MNIELYIGSMLYHTKINLDPGYVYPQRFSGLGELVEKSKHGQSARSRALG